MPARLGNSSACVICFATLRSSVPLRSRPALCYKEPRACCRIQARARRNCALRCPMSAVPPAEPGSPPAEKVKQFPAAPGVYLMKDAQGRVLYVGKAKNLRNRAGHYFTQAAAEDRRTADLVKLIADIDFLPA